MIEDKYFVEEPPYLVEEPQLDVRQERRVNQIRKRLNIGNEPRMNSQIGDYEMDYIILDMGSYVNILMIQTWEIMVKSRLVWSPFQPRLDNQLKVFHIARLTQVPIEKEGIGTYACFEVIDIVYYMTLYSRCLGIKWGIDNQTIINFKKRILTFEDA